MNWLTDARDIVAALLLVGLNGFFVAAEFALVKDESGTIVGVVTLENVLEPIVGAVEDEFDDEAPAIVNEGNGRFMVRGDASLAAVNREMNLLLEADNTDTLSEFLTAKVGQELQVGDKLDLQGAVAEVVEINGKCATKTRVTVSALTTHRVSAGQRPWK